MSIKNAVKKLASMLAVVVAVASASATSHAAFTPIGTPSAVTASASIGGTPTIAITNVAVLNLSNGQAATGGLSWSGLTAGYSNGQTGINSGWKVSDQYIQLTANINTTSGGIQFYTDNTNAAATPKFTGPNDGKGGNATPAGLVDVQDTTDKIPTAWTASTNTYAAGATALKPIDPNDANGFSWFYHEDVAQVANDSLKALAFQNGSSYVTVYAAPGTALADGENVPTNGGGVHYAAGLSPVTNTPPNVPQFGPFNSGTSVTNLYIEGNFSTSLAGRSYSTNRMLLEAFSI